VSEWRRVIPIPSWFHPCVLATPHHTFWALPALDYASTIIASGSDAYHYQTDKMGCSRFLVDVVLDRFSATGVYPLDDPLPTSVIILADAYDLPSSGSFGGTTPTTEEDCNRYQLYATFYRKLYQQTSFTLFKDYTHLQTKLVTAGACEPLGDAGIAV
jgi:hypothetical protein